MRIGHGYDVHALAQFGAQGPQRVRPLRLGGVTIPSERGCVAHSDGDAVVHALCDALFGAAALGDIGAHFPDTAAEFEGIDSLILLRRTVALVRAAGWCVGNVDCTIELQSPRLRPYIEAMRFALAEALEVDVGAISVKATTTEGLGFVGRGEGVAATAVVLLRRV